MNVIFYMEMRDFQCLYTHRPLKILVIIFASSIYMWISNYPPPNSFLNVSVWNIINSCSYISAVWVERPLKFWSSPLGTSWILEYGGGGSTIELMKRSKMGLSKITQVKMIEVCLVPRWERQAEIQRRDACGNTTGHHEILQWRGETENDQDCSHCVKLSQDRELKSHCWQEDTCWERTHDSKAEIVR